MKQLQGMKIGRLTVLERVGKATDGHALWRCLCECGNTKDISSNSLNRKSPVKSCGCLIKAAAQQRLKTQDVWNKGSSYLINNGERIYKTRHSWSKAVLKTFGNKCQKCGWDKARCDVHHKEEKSKGGIHSLSNAMVLCPNCHRIEHEKEKHK